MNEPASMHSAARPSAGSAAAHDSTAGIEVLVHVPAPLRNRCAGASELTIRANTMREVLGELERKHPELHNGVCDETGAVRRHVNLFVNTTNIRDGAGLDTRLERGDAVTILPAVSGG